MTEIIIKSEGSKKEEEFFRGSNFSKRNFYVYKGEKMKKTYILLAAAVLGVLTVSAAEKFLGFDCKDEAAMTAALSKSDFPEFYKLSYAVDLIRLQSPQEIGSYQDMCAVIDHAASRYKLSPRSVEDAKIQFPYHKGIFIIDGYNAARKHPFSIMYLTNPVILRQLALTRIQIYEQGVFLLANKTFVHALPRGYPGRVIPQLLLKMQDAFTELDPERIRADYQEIKKSFEAIIPGLAEPAKASLQKNLESVIAVINGNPASKLQAAAIFGNHMVLQRDIKIPVWGVAEPETKITVIIADNNVETTVDSGGKWRVELPPLKAGGPFELKISGSRTIVIKDVLVGEVWLCSGQSNMAFPVQQVLNAKDEIKTADYPKIRFLQVPQTYSAIPKTEFELPVNWQVCTPETVSAFSGVGYFFGRELFKSLNIPIGLVNSSYGDSKIDGWIPASGYHDSTELKNTKLPPELPLLEEMPQKTPTVLYNAMINPLVPYAFRGIIWYQGCANRGEGKVYVAKSHALLNSWRKLFENREMPFYFVQLAPYKTHVPYFWTVQQQFADEAKNAGIVVITDLGERENIHPANKQEVGRRLSLLALKNTYGKTGFRAESPFFKDYKILKNQLTVTFRNADSLKTRDGKAPDYFEIAGEDGRFFPATATINGVSVNLTSSQVSEPKSVRFAWSCFASPNLVNEVGLPAGPFQAGLHGVSY